MDTARLHIACVHCHAINRVPTARLAEDPVCGRCGKALLDGRPIDLTDANFSVITNRTELPILVDFWAPWCGPCKMMAPAFEEAAATLEPGMRLGKVNTDEEQELAAHFGIRSIPTLILFRGGHEVARQAGAMGTAAAIVQWARAHAA